MRHRFHSICPYFAILGGTILFMTLKRRRARGGAHDLSAAERRRAERLIDGGPRAARGGPRSAGQPRA